MTEKERIGSIVDEAYELIGFEPGEQPQWQDFCRLFVPSATLALRVFPQDDAITVMSLEEYSQAQMQHGLSDHGYTETPTNRTVEIFGSVAVVHQNFTMNFTHQEPSNAIDVFLLARDAAAWRIVSVVSDNT
ncbi:MULTISPECIES: hypothetical protein [unclassified Rhodococcus (in: high G+C Gram-positive bacteria)]|uniref:hypothetical protein n=1 Tax=unclassified Rhodococcus (in: high G+C Gram-positive bacteria) TaxID=192944 RepID=UPI000B9C2634|nr:MULTISPECIES: hypothetical protein [unclassified Rhodococcus (in: high G+C Gram-positive bacteria)]OZE43169.1 hypothetical protein CH259_00510 [Rhodococcus sp. 05-2254-4]OZE47355.1 hypothetical protein CH261_10270 [Rhodococcus sp. 05-2254-3]OZE47654.1 hypothetical protein CH283_18385 [Rhodococcus sp. 05-2254-2]